MGEQGLLVECADPAEVASTYRLLQQRAHELTAQDIVPAARTVLLDGLSDAAATADLLSGWEPAALATAAAAGVLVEIPTTYDGDDLAEVARQWDITTAEVIEIHQNAVFRVAFCGFAPGFAYCTGLGPELVVSRRPDPRPAVPAGSVGLAGEYTGIYPSASPGGWQLIGRTDARLWSLEREQPALLTPGDRVRFVDA